MRFEEARIGHIRIIADTMRPRDRDEVRVGWECEPEAAMAEALMQSYFARTMFYDLEPLCMYGLAPLMLMGGSARFWIFSTAAIDRHPIAFARACRQGLHDLFLYAGLMTNFVDLNDAPAVKWMQWMGGEIIPVHKFRGGRQFTQFILTDPRRRACRQG